MLVLGEISIVREIIVGKFRFVFERDFFSGLLFYLFMIWKITAWEVLVFQITTNDKIERQINSLRQFYFFSDSK